MQQHDSEEQEKMEEELEFGPDTVVELSPAGRALWETLLRECSVYAGRSIDGDELSRIVRTMRAELKQDDPDFRDPKVMECFDKLLRERARQ